MQVSVPLYTNLYTHTFTSCGVSGRSGPTLSNNYYNVAWSNYITSSGSRQGVQLWTAPLSTMYNFEVAGCAGIQNPGAATGAIMRGDLYLEKGQQIQILVGQYGGSNFETSGSGGTFVVDSSNNPLIIAGGGAGSVSTSGSANSNASASITSTARNSVDATGGSNGLGGASIALIVSSNVAHGGGGGFYSNSQLSPFGGFSFINSGLGGIGSNGYAGVSCDGRAQFGGFGGGGGVSASCGPAGGGGGGFSGGAAGLNWIGGGGGSYSIAFNQSNTELAQGNSNAGYVKITLAPITGSNNPISFSDLQRRLGSNSGTISMSQLYGRFNGLSTSGAIGFTDVIGKTPVFGIPSTKTNSAFVLGPYNLSTWNTSFPTSNASWIWHSSNANSGANIDTIPKAYEKVYYLNSTSNVPANLYYAADNSLYITLNRSYVGYTGIWTPVSSNTVTLLPGSNMFEFYASNGGGPAGFIYSVVDNQNNVLAVSDSTTYFANSNSVNNMLYMSFDAAATSNNGVNNAMTTWTNTGWTGWNFNATASNNPILRYNQRWYVEFTRSNSSHFNINTALPTLLNTWGGLTIFVVGQMTNPGFWERFLDFGNAPANNNIIVGRYSINTSNIFEIFNSNGSSVTTNYLVNQHMDSNWNIWTYATQVTGSGTAVTVYRNGTSNASLNTPMIANDRVTFSNYLGRSHWSGDAYFNGNVSEYRFYNGFLNSNDVSIVYNELKTKWNL